MAQLNPSPTKPIVSYPTASIEDKELVTVHDTRLPDYKPLEYGTLFKDQVKFPGVKLVYQEPFGEDDRMVRRIWAGDRRDQDLYNADRKYSGGSMEHPIIIRRYIFPEDGYAPVPTGTPDTQFSDAVLVDEEVTHPENRNGYISVTRVYETLPGPTLTGVLVTEKGQLANITTQTVAPNTTVTASALTVTASVKPDGKGKSLLEKVEVPELFDEKSFSIENPDPVPQKFRIAAPSTTVEETVVGTAAQPLLATGELAASEQQLTKFTKRKKKTSRSTTALPKSLTQTATTNNGLKAAVVETLQVGDTTANPSATVSVESEAMGDGTYVVRTTTLPEVFDEKSFSIENPDPVPQKFRIAAPSTTVEETVVGTAAQPLLATGELAASEQQLTKFTKRNKKTSRSTTALPKSLTQTATTNNGLKAVVVETLQVGGTTANPSATVSVESEAMGDGTYVVRTTTLPEVFDEKTVSVKKPEVIPERFRAAVPDETVSAIEEGVGIPSSVTLDVDEVSKTEQRLTKYTKRVETVKRSKPAYPQLEGQTYDEVLDENLPYTESISASIPSQVGAEATPLSDNEYLIKTFDIDAIKSKLEQISYDLETEVNISLPDRLENFQVHWETAKSEGGAAGEPVRTMFWTAYSGVTYVEKATDSAHAQATIRPAFSYTLIRGYRGPASAVEHIRFVDNPNSFSASQFGDEWPIWNETGGTIVLTGQSQTARKTVKRVTHSYYSPTGGAPSINTGTTVLEDSTGGDTSYHVAQIPPSIHGSISASGQSYSASAARGVAVVSVSATGTVTGSIAASSPASITGGTYVVSKSFTPYKYGLWKVSVVTVDITPYI